MNYIRSRSALDPALLFGVPRRHGLGGDAFDPDASVRLSERSRVGAFDKARLKTREAQHHMSPPGDPPLSECLARGPAAALADEVSRQIGLALWHGDEYVEVVTHNAAHSLARREPGSLLAGVEVRRCDDANKTRASAYSEVVRYHVGAINYTDVRRALEAHRDEDEEALVEISRELNRRSEQHHHERGYRQ